MLPPIAELPPLEGDEALYEMQIHPDQTLQDSDEHLVRKGGQTGIILTEEELERLRRQSDRPLYIYTPKPTKRR